MQDSSVWLVFGEIFPEDGGEDDEHGQQSDYEDHRGADAGLG